MNHPSSHIPFYRQMIAYPGDALDLLDQQGQEEVLQFLLSQQNPDGGFQDRGGRSELYYSLFGAFILQAISRPLNLPKGDFEEQPNNVSDAIAKLRQFISEQKIAGSGGFIGQCCLVLLQKDLKIQRTSRIKAILALVKSFWKERYSINLSYRSFVLFLTLDAVLPSRRILKAGAKKMLARTTVDQHSPCSEVAARVFLQKIMNQNGLDDQELLKSFACERGGFKAFAHLEKADMLSTAVALFALKYAGSDLRLQKPACLCFIQQNFSEGAFLSGDGDQTADLEYTFYGLLALGLLKTQ